MIPRNIESILLTSQQVNRFNSQKFAGINEFYGEKALIHSNETKKQPNKLRAVH